MLDNVVFLVEAEPSPEDPDLLGIYEGTPLTERGEWWGQGSLPDRITLFRGPLTRMCEDDEELPSRIAALGWHGHGEVAVLVGTTPPQFDVDQLRRSARKLGVDVLIGVQGSRLVLVLGRAELPGRPDDEPELPFP